MDLFETLGIEVDFGPEEYGLLPCFECGRPGEHEHHVVPQSKGGTKTVVLCGRCHGLVHDLKLNNHRALTRAALAAKRRRRERTGSVPLGFVLADDGVQLEPCEEERLTIDICAALRELGLSYRAVCRALDRLNRPTRSGAPWHPKQAHRMSNGDGDKDHRLYRPDLARGREALKEDAARLFLP